MRQFLGSSRTRRTTALLVATVIVMSLIVPAAVFAVTYKVSIKSNVTSRYVGQSFVFSGTVTPKRAGKTMQVYIRKSTAVRWTKINRTLSSKSTWSYRWWPKSSGKYYVKAGYGTARSARIMVTVKPKIPVVLASTTSTQDSGLFDDIIPRFQKAYPAYAIKVIAVGSGEAMEIGKRKDADVLLVHSPSAEVSFVNGGYGFDRKPVMYNDFMLVGPSSDPAATRTKAAIADCMKAIYSTQSKFVSRGDNSGTHSKEKALWALAGYTYNTDIVPKSWYISAGQGMGETLKIAAEKQAYTLVDRATWLTNKPAGLVVVQEGDANLYNQYSVIEVTGARQPRGADAFAKWITGHSNPYRSGDGVNEGQYWIGRFGVAKYGQRLFVPNAPY